MISYTSCGLSIDQIKKDAKSLKKSNQIEYHQALDIIVSEKTNFKSWNELNNSLKKLGYSIGKLNFEQYRFVFMANKPAMLIVLPPGYGKTYMAKELIKSSQLRPGNVLCFSANHFDFKGDNIKCKNFDDLITYKRGDNFQHSLKVLFEDRLEEIYQELNDSYSVLILDEVARYHSSLNDAFVQKLIKKCIKNKTIILFLTQYIDEIFLYRIKNYLSHAIFLNLKQENKIFFEQNKLIENILKNSKEFDLWDAKLNLFINSIMPYIKFKNKETISTNEIVNLMNLDTIIQISENDSVPDEVKSSLNNYVKTLMYGEKITQRERDLHGYNVLKLNGFLRKSFNDGIEKFDVTKIRKEILNYIYFENSYSVYNFLNDELLK